MRALVKDGYACTRAAASLGLFDIIAIGPDDVRCIQVKSNRWPGRPEKDALLSFTETHPHVSVEIWRWDDWKDKPKVKNLSVSLQVNAPVL